MNPIEARLDYRFKNAGLLLQALTHKSFAYEQRAPEFHNEKLEFLGDAVLDLVLGEFLFELYPAENEGALSKKRASLVNEESLARLAMALDLASHLRLGKGETHSGGATKPRLLASAWEALAGALYMDGDFAETKRVLRAIFLPAIQALDLDVDFAADYKTRVQEIAQKELKSTPVYELVGEDGPAHDRVFTVAVKIRDQEYARGSGRSKKQAEQQAAKEALARWGAPAETIPSTPTDTSSGESND